MSCSMQKGRRTSLHTCASLLQHHHTRGFHSSCKHPGRPRLVPVPSHARDLKRGLLRAIIRQAGMTRLFANFEVRTSC
jgi:hypothetical protein